MSGGVTQPARISQVAIPAEHGGWSLTFEPVLLGLIVAPSAAGVALGIAALVAFLLRTSAKTALVDRRRGRRLPRTILAERVAFAELVVLAAAVAPAFAISEHPFWLPIVVAAPLVMVEIWFDVRSRSRRLVPELLGAIGMGAVAAAIVLAGGGAGTDAAGVWVVLAARSVAAIPFVRVQLRRAKGQAHRFLHSDAAQALAVAAAVAGFALEVVPAAGAAAVIALAVAHAVLVRTRPPRTAILGAQQVVLGLTVVLATGLGMLAP